MAAWRAMAALGMLSVLIMQPSICKASAAHRQLRQDAEGDSVVSPKSREGAQEYLSRAEQCAALGGLMSVDLANQWACCPAFCKTCGGADGCDKLLGGKDACCPATIQAANLKCSEIKAPPCVLDAGGRIRGPRNPDPPPMGVLPDPFKEISDAKGGLEESDIPPPTELWGDCTETRLCQQGSVCRLAAEGWAQCRPELEMCPPPDVEDEFDCTIIGSSVHPPLKDCYKWGYQYSGTVLETRETTDSPWQCQTRCQMKDKCVGVNFISDQQGKCILMASTTGTEAKPGVGWLAAPKTCGWDRLTNPVQKDFALELWLSDLIGNMTLEEKAGQMIIAPIFGVPEPEVTLKKYSLGAMLWPPGFYREAKIWQVAAEMDNFYAAAMDKEWASGIPIPPLMAADAIHGHNNAPHSTIFPHNIGLGAANDSVLMEKIGLVTATEMVASGIDWTLAPTVATARDTRWGRMYESYSEDGYTVENIVGGLLRGLQGNPEDPESFLAAPHVLATCKHWLGDGGSWGGLTDGDTVAAETELRDIHSRGYRACIEKGGVQSVMPSFTGTNTIEMHGYPFLLTDVLKNTYNLDGFLVGDWNGHARSGNDENGENLPGCTVEHCPFAINAGMDMLMIGGDWISFINNTARAVESGEIPLERMDDAVRRILRAKARLGLIGPDPTKVKGKPSTRKPYAARDDLMASDEHMEVAREAVRKSLVLLKNNRHVLPLKRSANIFVTSRLIDDVPYADFLPTHVGSWALSWQAEENTNADFLYGTSIWKGLSDVVTGGGGAAMLSKNGSDDFAATGEYDAIVAVIGEERYAEAAGDLKENSLLHHARYPADLDILDKITAKKSPDTPIVCLLVSGRPVYVNQHLNRCDAFVAAWLPGVAAGLGVGDVLFEGGYDFHGRLAHSWPASPCQATVNVGDGQEALFPFSYGLRMNQGETDEVGYLRELSDTRCT
ncbi:unnamed protein product [Vitrella brassicaformis CCMP3155]|uniref:Apple domain-containing protein n=3 Tax=Vitrella brassicaformis TaxID=1169539 RepID=A0A0G4F356_VITBC|nr:unnamed protein product [Vitrella brassicaformis CCMP3155]|eukprot:CEM05833.1 unnamed protein product [Vitrella brassicaformis CCMP3155]